MKVVVFGATGGTGRAVIKMALAAGHNVTAFARRADRIAPADGLNVVEGDAMDKSDVVRTLNGQDAVVISLGNSQNAFALMFGAGRTTPKDICEIGTRNILEGLPKGRNIPIVVVGAFGTGDTAPNLPFMFKLFYRLILREQMADKEKQDQILKGSTASYTLVQPLALTDKPGTGTWNVSHDGIYGKTEVPRDDLSQFILETLEEGDHSGKTVTFSG
ncbi:hypothetical protein P775_11455 [Puniceibacterium antarcticum]|uniref:NAD(P)-binding domain-containing protein n=1 Tax=Puniceibacterium antarcticum TaxID=1206336 RepID=A0A2G8REX2_9RHOB|nr:NAD(P)H-binding protein [Puniceibacterium antarcticum]PIL20089.1 hypothetical protein P775_11455 [Puniceibacterium antarcticum]